MELEIIQASLSKRQFAGNEKFVGQNVRNSSEEYSPKNLRELLTLVNPVRHAVVNAPVHPCVGYLVVVIHLCFRSVVDIVLMHVDQSVAVRRPFGELQRRRLVRRQYRFRPANTIISRVSHNEPL